MATQYCIVDKDSLIFLDNLGEKVIGEDFVDFEGIFSLFWILGKFKINFWS